MVVQECSYEAVFYQENVKGQELRSKVVQCSDALR